MEDDLCDLAGIPGLEPRYAESESAVLPLNYIPNCESIIKPLARKIKSFFLNQLKSRFTTRPRPVSATSCPWVRACSTPYIYPCADEQSPKWPHVRPAAEKASGYQVCPSARVRRCCRRPKDV